MRRAALLLLCLTGCGPPRPPPPPPPPSEPAPAPPSPAAAAAQGLRRLQASLDADPVVRAALDPADGVDPEARRDAWQAGRRRFLELVAAAHLRELTFRLARRPATPEVVSDASGILLLERLLARTALGEVPLYPEGEDPLLRRILDGAVALRWEPAADGRQDAPPPGAGEHPAYDRAWTPYREALARGERSWVALRGIEDLRVLEGPAQGTNPRLRIQTLGGAAFEDPAEAVGAGLLGGMYRPRDRERLRLAPHELDLALRPVSGDLFLLLVAWDLTRTCHLELRLRGREQTLRILISRPGLDEAVPGPPDDLPAGYLVRIRGTALPRGVRRLHLRAVGLQGVGRPEATVLLGEVLQQVAGPVPEAFADHAWAAPPPDDAELHRRRQAALADTLARLRAGPEGGRGPDSLIAAAQALRAAGDGELASQLLRRADQLRGSHPATLNLLGEVAWELGDHPGALASWRRSLQVDPAGRAAALLTAHAPTPPSHHRVRSAEEFLELATALVDFRRQGELRRALRRLRRARGEVLVLGPEDSAARLDELHQVGFLARGGGPPSGRGVYLAGPDGEVSSSVFGSARAPRAPPPALAAREGWSAPAAVVVAAMATGAPAAVEVGLPRLDEAELREHLPPLAPRLAELVDPWARDILLARLTQLAGQGATSVLRPYREWLERLAAGDDPAAAAARRLLSGP